MVLLGKPPGGGPPFLLALGSRGFGGCLLGGCHSGGLLLGQAGFLFAPSARALLRADGRGRGLLLRGLDGGSLSLRVTAGRWAGGHLGRRSVLADRARGVVRRGGFALGKLGKDPETQHRSNQAQGNHGADDNPGPRRRRGPPAHLRQRRRRPLARLEVPQDLLPKRRVLPGPGRQELLAAQHARPDLAEDLLLARSAAVVGKPVRGHGRRGRFAHAAAGIFEPVRRRPPQDTRLLILKLADLEDRLAARSPGRGNPPVGRLGQQVLARQDYVQPRLELPEVLGQRPQDALQPSAQGGLVGRIPLQEARPETPQQRQQRLVVHRFDDPRERDPLGALVAARLPQGHEEMGTVPAGDVPVEPLQRLQIEPGQHLRQEQLVVGAGSRFGWAGRLGPQRLAPRRQLRVGSDVPGQNVGFALGGDVLKRQQLGNPLLGKPCKQKLHRRFGAGQGRASGRQLENRQLGRPPDQRRQLGLRGGELAEGTAQGLLQIALGHGRGAPRPAGRGLAGPEQDRHHAVDRRQALEVVDPPGPGRPHRAERVVHRSPALLQEPAQDDLRVGRLAGAGLAATAQKRVDDRTSGPVDLGPQVRRLGVVKLRGRQRSAEPVGVGLERGEADPFAQTALGQQADDPVEHQRRHRRFDHQQQRLAAAAVGLEETQQRVAHQRGPFGRGFPAPAGGNHPAGVVERAARRRLEETQQHVVVDGGPAATEHVVERAERLQQKGDFRRVLFHPTRRPPKLQALQARKARLPVALLAKQDVGEVGAGATLGVGRAVTDLGDQWQAVGRGEVDQAPGRRRGVQPELRFGGGVAGKVIVDVALDLAVASPQRAGFQRTAPGTVAQHPVGQLPLLPLEGGAAVGAVRAVHLVDRGQGFSPSSRSGDEGVRG